MKTRSVSILYYKSKEILEVLEFGYHASLRDACDFLLFYVLCSINSRDSNEERCAFATSFSHPFLLLVLNSTRGMIGMSMVLSCGILVFLSSLARAACVLGVYVSSCRQIFFAWMSLHGLSDSKIMLSFGNRI